MIYLFGDTNQSCFESSIPAEDVGVSYEDLSPRNSFPESGSLDDGLLETAASESLITSLYHDDVSVVTEHFLDSDFVPVSSEEDPHAKLIDETVDSEIQQDTCDQTSLIDFASVEEAPEIQLFFAEHPMLEEMKPLFREMTKEELYRLLVILLVLQQEKKGKENAFLGLLVRFFQLVVNVIEKGVQKILPELQEELVAA